LARERTQVGLAAAPARGRQGGQPKKMDTAANVAMARALYAGRQGTIAEIGKSVDISRATLYRHLDTPATADSQPGDR
jgi:DNA invertase Pin-like site-specific DNA recombinase